MKLSLLGEFGLIDKIKEDCVNDRTTLAVGIGDDAAVLTAQPRRSPLVSCDMLVENVHFDLSYTSPFELGVKAAAVNLSDIAAMGGRAENLFVSLALPKNSRLKFIEEFYNGLKDMAKRYSVNIAGGDTVASPQGIVINITVTGSCQSEELCLRSQARAGDFIAVTGTLGDAAAGLRLLQNGGGAGLDFAAPLIRRQLVPQPQLEIAGRIARHVHAMNDISDGLSSESHEIAAASGVKLILDEEKLPLSRELLQAALWMNADATDFALYGGEDYQLVLTLDEAAYALLRTEKEPLTLIGHVETGRGVFLRQKDGRIVELTAKGYNHFR